MHYITHFSFMSCYLSRVSHAFEEGGYYTYYPLYFGKCFDVIGYNYDFTL